MMDHDKLKLVIEGYKKDFKERWEDEKYKWEAIRHFQDHWNINAENFGEMFKVATEKTLNLLASGYAYPRGMMINFARADDNAVRKMFIDLYDESRDIAERIYSFQASCEEIRAKYDDGTWHNHYQNTNAISTYLWLRYPDQYYIYKYDVYRDVSDELNCSYHPKRNGSADNMIDGFIMYDEICSVIREDHELVQMLNDAIADTCYCDSQLKTLTMDVGYYLSRIYLKKINIQKEEEWFPKDYHPGITAEDWIDLLNDSSVFDRGSLEIMKRMKDYGGQATCKQLSIRYGETVQFYKNGSSSLARRVAKKTGCALISENDENSKWWPILYMGKDAGKDEDGSFIWRLRSELAEALNQVNLSDVTLYTEKDKNRQYWWLNANPKIWSFSDIQIGGEQSYTLYNDNGNKRRIFQNFLDVKEGDIVIGYEAYPMKKIVAVCEITHASDGNQISFVKKEGLSVPIEYAVLKNCPELEKMEFFVQQNGSLFKLTKGEFEFIMDIIREENPIKAADAKKYTKADFLKDVFMSEERFNILEARLRNKMNIILQGAPGVGKTFTAKKLAYAMMGEEDDSRIEMVQFHQNYSYEDFIMGYRPDGDGFKLKDGIFYHFCKMAENHPGKDFFFIIDEINRGNLSKIFGELMMLIEKEYRTDKVTLAYNGMSFSVPDNLYIIGMMNTADRSLAMIDYALRRRFSFFEMEPAFNSEGFQNYQKQFGNETFDALIEEIKKLNREIAEDPSLGKGFRIGHSYFCGCKKDDMTTDWMRSVVEFDILPMLEEYWFDESDKLQKWTKILRGVFDDE